MDNLTNMSIINKIMKKYGLNAYNPRRTKITNPQPTSSTPYPRGNLAIHLKLVEKKIIKRQYYQKKDY